PKAKAYADQFIKKHLEGVANGQTYSQVSGKALQNPKDAQLQAQVQTLFRGETLRGLLLNVWGWATLGAIAFWVGIGSLLGAVAVFAALLIGYLLHRHAMKRAAEGETKGMTVGSADEVRMPVAVN
ncbi:MAG TPA: hypothetical protein VL856_03690, partial [Acidimicrobiia bacterium]|nr:hypothetical protein [Acidimicrobiia bacterium]